MAILEHAQISGIDTCVSSGKFDEFRLKIKTAIRKANKQDSLFANKAALDSLSTSNTLIGRQKEIDQLVSYLIGHKKGFDKSRYCNTKIYRVWPALFTK